jgi:hypothetical protein
MFNFREGKLSSCFLVFVIAILLLVLYWVYCT